MLSDKQKRNFLRMIIVTATSSNHFVSLLNFIDSFASHAQEKHKLIVYNLGLTSQEQAYLASKAADIGFKVRDFAYADHPDWFNVNINAGEYAWKPTIIHEVWQANKNTLLLWMDAGNLIHDNLQKMEEFLLLNHIYAANTYKQSTSLIHPKTLAFLKATAKQQRSAACIGFNTATLFVQNLIADFNKYAHIRECIAPTGSHRGNHGQDQAVFSILFWKVQEIYKFKVCNGYTTDMGFTIHNDVSCHVTALFTRVITDGWRVCLPDCVPPQWIKLLHLPQTESKQIVILTETDVRDIPLPFDTITHQPRACNFVGIFRIPGVTSPRNFALMKALACTLKTVSCNVCSPQDFVRTMPYLRFCLLENNSSPETAEFVRYASAYNVPLFMLQSEPIYLGNDQGVVIPNSRIDFNLICAKLDAFIQTLHLYKPRAAFCQLASPNVYIDKMSKIILAKMDNMQRQITLG